MSSSRKPDVDKPTAGKKVTGKSYSLFLPFLIVMAALILSGARETVSLRKQKMAFVTQNQQAAEALNRSAKQMEALHKLQDDLHTLAATDPIAEKITLEFFPPGNALGQNSTGN